MSTWTRAYGGQRCGGCGVWLVKGDPVLVIPLAGQRRTLLRCAGCREAPAELPAAIGRVPNRVDLVPMLTRLGLIAPDFSARRLGERDPGEEG
jgi:hypothetical protein